MLHDDDPTQLSGKNLRQSIGAAARRARKRLELTQEAVGEIIGVSPEFYARLERGHALPSVSTFSRLMIALTVRGDELLGLPDRRTPGATPRPWLWSASQSESREMRSLARRLRRASPSLLRLISMLLDEFEARGKGRKSGPGEPGEEQ